MNERYFRGLKELVLPSPNHRRYDLLLDKLYSESFIPLVDRDDNRASDGLYLREFYGYSDTCPCSILEMLIALAGRFDGNSGFDPDEVYENFWILLNNIGLDEYFDERYSEREVWSILRIFETRTYNFNGKGGLFPLKKPQNDQRNVEIWDQMQAWEIENFGI